MRRLDLIITEVRKETDNSSFTETSGLQDSEFIRWANAAQMRLFTLIQKDYSTLFQREIVIPGVANQEAYSIPPKAFLGTRISLVEYSQSGLDTDYYVLKTGSLRERVSGLSGNPSFYAQRGSQFLVQPKPQSTGTFRVTYQYDIPRVDIRRATVGSVTLDTTTRTITSLVFDNTIDIDAENIQNEGFICIVDKNGVQLMNAIPVDEVNMSTGTVTVSADFVYDDGETLPVGSFAVIGDNSTTHSILPPACERYFHEAMIWKTEKRDANSSSMEQSQELETIASEIVQSFALPDDDVHGITILDNQFLESNSDSWF